MKNLRIVLALLAVGACATSPNASTGQTSAPTPQAQPAAPAQASVATKRIAQLPADSFEIARKYTMWFYTAQADSLWAHESAAFREGSSKDEMIARLAEVTARAGTEVQLLEEKFITRNGKRQYWRTAKFTTLEEPLMVRWVINAEGQIDGLGLNPKSQAPPIDP
jgi:hypothetical protein